MKPKATRPHNVSLPTDKFIKIATSQRKTKAVDVLKRLGNNVTFP